MYAAAHPTGKALDTIRRELDYFRPNLMGNQWAGWTMPEVLPEKPDEGPTSVSRARGINLIGVDVEKGHFTDFSPEMIVEKYMNLISTNRD